MSTKSEDERAQRTSYVGDGVYVEAMGHQFRIYTSDGVYESNNIYIEPETWASMKNEVERLMGWK